MSADELEAIDRILDGGSDPDGVLRAVVTELALTPGIEWAGILFTEAGELALGPEAGVADPSRRVVVPVSYQGSLVGALAADGSPEPLFLERVAERIGTHVLLGWDTGGEAWEP